VLGAGTHRLGPRSAVLCVHTRRVGAAAKAGHDLTIEVTAWEAAIVVGEADQDVSLELSVDSSSLRVQEGHGGMMELDDADRENIHQTIDDEVLQEKDNTFRSTAATADGDVIHAEGELTLGGNTEPMSFDLRVDDDGSVSGSAVVKQTAWGIKPYSALFGALKVADEVLVELKGRPDS
jgi:polyisoprenoid-binding protein YceI